MNPTDGVETFGSGPSAVLGRQSRLLAHQGGWDEILLVAGPLLIVALLLWIANRRVTAQLEQANAADGAEPNNGTQPGSPGRSER